jgi:acetolactate synthase-1/2/3 large subunit
VYRADLAICALPGEFAESAALWDEGEVIPFDAGGEAHESGWPGRRPKIAVIRWTSPPASRLPAASLPADSVICNGAGNFSDGGTATGTYAGYPSQLAPTAGAMGYGLPAAVAAALRFSGALRGRCRRGRRLPVNAQETGHRPRSTAFRPHRDRDRQWLIRHDPHAPGTIYPGRIAATDLANPDFAALGAAFGAWSRKVESTADFAEGTRRSAGAQGASACSIA